MKLRRLHLKRKRFWLPLLLVFIIGSIIAYHSFKPLPAGLSYEGEIHQLENISFLYDLTYKDLEGKKKTEQQIFKRMLEAAGEAEEFIVLDMFLFNGYDMGKGNLPNISEQLTNKLLELKQEKNLDIYLITDEINLTYGAHPSDHMQKLRDHGVQVIFTDLKPLRDSNPLYSGIWRTFFQWFGESGNGWLPDPMAKKAPDVTLRSYLELLNLKANHRKVFITDKTAIVASANPHDASGLNSNIAIEAGGNVIGDLLKTEQAVADFSGGVKLPEISERKERGAMKAQVLTEGKIRKHIAMELDSSKKGDTVWIGMFYLADRKIIDHIDSAADRDVKVRIILDPNKNAFGNQKAGLPNVPVAAELQRLGNKNIEIKWYNVGEEQYHPKMIYFDRKQEGLVIGGSANFTRRNLDDYNPETDLKYWGPSDTKGIQEVNSYFKRIWENQGGNFTLEYEKDEDALTPAKYIIYWLQKMLRFTTY